LRIFVGSLVFVLLASLASIFPGSATAGNQKETNSKFSVEQKNSLKLPKLDNEVGDQKFLVTKSEAALSFSLMVPKNVSISRSRNYYSCNFYFFEPERNRDQRPFLLVSIVPQKNDHVDSAKESLKSAMISIRKTHRLNWTESPVSEFRLAALNFIKQSWSASEPGDKRLTMQHGFVLAGTKGSTLILGLSTCESQSSVKEAERIFQSLNILN